MDDLGELKDKLATAVQILRWELADMWGHISCRSPRGDSFLILPLRPPYDHSLSQDELLEYDLEGNLISGRRDPPAEIFFFTALYKAKKDAGAVIHCHPPAAVSLVATGKKIVPMYQHAIKFGKHVPVSPWLYGTWREDGERAAKAMGKSCALMMKGHGANVIGKSDSGGLSERGSLRADGEDDLTGGQRRPVQPTHSDSGEKIPRRGSWTG